MAKMKSRVSATLAVCLATTLLFTACKADVPEKVDFIPETMESVASGVVAQNDRFTMEWDDSYKCVLLRELNTGRVWSTTPYNYYLNGDTDDSMSSPIMIEYYDASDASLQQAEGFQCIDSDLVSTEMGEQGLRCTFYFKEPEIAVTVTYTLRGDSLSISLNSADFKEYGSQRLISVSVAPYLCSVANTEDHGNYIFVPVGGGALMYTDEDKIGSGREYVGEVYGNDWSRTTLDSPADEEKIRLPVFGVKDGDSALCAIIEDGEGAARIRASSGSYATGYSNVYASFYVRGFNNIEWDTGKSVNGHALFLDAILMHDSFQENKTFSVGYYPLSGDNASYSGMAACYRQHLKDAGLWSNCEKEQQAYHLNIVGGALTKKFTLGVPHTSVIKLTSFSDSQEIIRDLNDELGRTPEVLLKGFGNSGVDVGQVAGGFQFASALGGESQQQNLEKFCAQQGISLYTDFDLVRFNKSGDGFNIRLDTAKTANSQSATYLPLKKNVRSTDDKQTATRLLQRSKLPKALDKLRDFTANRVSGIGLSTLGSMAYSDYGGEAYMLKDGLREQIKAAQETLSDHPILYSAANEYAAAVADGICDVPLQNGLYDALDAYVPFYAMVFRGTVPLYSTPLNLSPIPQGELLCAVEAGVSPAFTVGAATDSALVDNVDTFYNGILYSSNKELIADTVKQTADYFDKIKGAGIRSHSILMDGLTQTTFDNGVTVLVNHTDSDIQWNGQIIPAQSFHY